MQDRSASSQTKPLSIDEISKEFEQVWKGKKDTTLPVYMPIAEKTKGSFVGSIYEKSPTAPKNWLNQSLDGWVN